MRGGLLRKDICRENFSEVHHERKRFFEEEKRAILLDKKKGEKSVLAGEGPDQHAGRKKNRGINQRYTRIGGKVYLLFHHSRRERKTLFYTVSKKGGEWWGGRREKCKYVTGILEGGVAQAGVGGKTSQCYNKGDRTQSIVRAGSQLRRGKKKRGSLMVPTKLGGGGFPYAKEIAGEKERKNGYYSQEEKNLGKKSFHRCPSPL